MAQRPNIHSWLQRDGTSQSQRRLAKLDPDSAPIDGRDIADFFVFAKRFARRVIYRDLKNIDRGDWEGFFGCDASAVIAAIEKTNPMPLRDNVRKALDSKPHPQNLNLIFKHMAELACKVNDWREGVGQTIHFREQIDKLIQANLATTWLSLVAYHRAGAQRYASIIFSAADYTGFSSVWLPDSPKLLGNPRDVAPDHGLFGTSDSIKRQLQDAYKKIETLFVPLYRVLQDIIGLAPRYFARDLVGRSNHEPHFALFVAFLRLYLLVRNDANRLTQRHLEFYYEKVLGIKKRPAMSDKLHLLVKLARQVKSEHLLRAGTALDAGKDESGVLVRYELDEDLVANRAQIESFRTVFVKYDRNKNVLPVKGVFAAPVAKSQDGLGAEIEDTERPSWPTLGSAAMPKATLGFALASRALLLDEGTRTIELELQAVGLPEEPIPADVLIAQLSGEKGWITPDVATLTVPPESVSSTTVGGVTVRGGTLKLHLELKSTAASVTFANADALGESFDTTDPVLKLTLRSPSADELIYGLLKDLKLQKVTLTTNVEGIKNVIVQNDQFTMDPGKTFQPFGPSPSVGSNFYVGCAEVFQKDLTGLRLHITWDALPESFAKHYEGYDIGSGEPANGDFEIKVQMLQDGNWLPKEVEDEKSLFDEDDAKKTIAESLLDFTTLDVQQPRVIDVFTAWTPATQHGFLRLQLSAPDQAFFHDQYVNVLTRQTLAAGRLPKCTPGAKYRDGNGSITCMNDSEIVGKEVIIPNAPYTPTIKAMELSYDASIDTETSPTKISFYHLEPFGYRAIPLANIDQKLTTVDAGGDANPHLLPQFDDEGTLYLGIRDLKPPQSLSILFQVADGTGNTDVPKPEVKWSYLTDDKWSDPEDLVIANDTTQGLTTSGIVTFMIPRGIATDNTRLPIGLSWLRATVSHGASGVSELIDAHTQAVRASFVDNDNDPKCLDTPLPAETISGLVREDAKVASISQPYDGFGGRPVEKGLTFYTRVAEHLRHKGRPITLFDYERMILERFPDIYKVKCINHTKVKNSDDERGKNSKVAGSQSPAETISEHQMAPGYVLIAVIADFRKLKAVDRRRPKVTLDKLDEIADFILAINCPFVRNNRSDKKHRLQVLNPVYEKVGVSFKVRFMPGITAIDFYRRELNTAINRFLSPWAYEDGAEISFGGRVYKSSILNFVENQPYVDYVTDFVMTRGEPHQNVDEDLDSIQATTPRSVLVPVKIHDIAEDEKLMCPRNQPCTERDGIGRMTVGESFEIR
jgi:hypothetical protein